MPTKNVVAVTIAAGDAMSTAGDLTTLAMTAILIPSDWTAANISFQMSDDISFYNLLDVEGREFLMPVGPGSALNMDTSLTDGALWIKVRSGSNENPIQQISACTVKLICV
jgi:hypothetical protein